MGSGGLERGRIDGRTVTKSFLELEIEFVQEIVALTSQTELCIEALARDTPLPGRARRPSAKTGSHRGAFR